MYFFIKTQNPRPTFHLDMTPDERAIMERHVAYWSDKAARGIAIVFGPVTDPQGAYASARTKSKTRPKCVTSSSMTPPTGSCTTKSCQCPAQSSGHCALDCICRSTTQLKTK